jgi:hypothetical protein
MSNPLTRTTFAGHEGATFRIRDDGGEPASLTLTEVSAARPEGDRPFSLVFNAAADVMLQQGTYRLEHDTIGSFDLFLVPIRPDAASRQMRYEAIFN